MIKAVIVINAQGKVRLVHFYESAIPLSQRQELIKRLHARVASRDDSIVCNFIVDDGSAKNNNNNNSNSGDDNINNSNAIDWPTPDTQMIYRKYATLVFIFVTDNSESPLAILDLIQVLVESLDRLFENVCELDFIFHSERALGLLQAVIHGSGAVAETGREVILKQTFETEKLKNSKTPATTAASGIGGSGVGYGRSGFR